MNGKQRSAAQRCGAQVESAEYAKDMGAFVNEGVGSLLVGDDEPAAAAESVPTTAAVESTEHAEEATIVSKDLIVYPTNEERIAELAASYKGITFETPENYEKGRKAIAFCRDLRGSLTRGCFAPLGVFGNLPGVIKWIPGRLLPRRWGFHVFGLPRIRSRNWGSRLRQGRNSMSDHNTPSDSDWCNHGKGWLIDCEACGRRGQLEGCTIPISNLAVRVRLEMLEHAVFAKTSLGSPPVLPPQGDSLAADAALKNSSSASWLGAPRGEPGGIFTRERLDQLAEVLAADNPREHFDARVVIRAELKVSALEIV